jgi:hypothetical protein
MPFINISIVAECLPWCEITAVIGNEQKGLKRRIASDPGRRRAVTERRRP